MAPIFEHENRCRDRLGLPREQAYAAFRRGASYWTGQRFARLTLCATDLQFRDNHMAASGTERTETRTR